MKTIYFNTGRLYTAKGQRITATLKDDGVVTFFDHDRMIDGQFVLLHGVECTPQKVMAAYDNGTYQHTRQSWQDGMLKDGCNATWKE